LVKQGTTTFQVSNIRKLTGQSALNRKPQLQQKLQTDFTEKPD
jgi:hypothetical protein